MQHFPRDAHNGGIEPYHMHHAYAHIIRRYAPVLQTMFEDIYPIRPDLHVRVTPDEDGHVWFRAMQAPDGSCTVIQPYAKDHAIRPRSTQDVMTYIQAPSAFGPTTPGKPLPEFVLYQTTIRLTKDIQDRLHRASPDVLAHIDIPSNRCEVPHHHHHIRYFLTLMQGYAAIMASPAYGTDGHLDMAPIPPHIDSFAQIEQVFDTAIQQDGNIPGPAVQACLEAMYRYNMVDRTDSIIRCTQHILQRMVDHDYTMDHPFTCNDTRSKAYPHPEDPRILVIVDHDTAYDIFANPRAVQIYNAHKRHIYNIYRDITQAWRIIQYAGPGQSNDIERMHLCLSSIDCCSEETLG